MKYQTGSFACLALLASLLTACSSNNNDPATGDGDNPVQPIAAFEDSGLPSARLNTLIKDSVNPNALTELTLATLSTQAWISTVGASLPDAYFSSIVPEDEAIVQTLDCDNGSVTATQWGNSTLQSTRLEFRACQNNQTTLNGRVLVENSFLGFCTGGPSLSFVMDNFTLSTPEDEDIVATGRYGYVQQSVNCGSAAAGPAGFSNGLRADLTSLSHGLSGNPVSYTDFQLTHTYQEMSVVHAGDEHRIELSLSIEDPVLSEQGISVIFVEPMNITSAVTQPNTGTLIISASNGAAITYSFLECAKDLALITRNNNETQSEALTLAWTDERNVLAQFAIAVAPVRDHTTGEVSRVLPSTYSADQSIDGC